MVFYVKNILRPFLNPLGLLGEPLTGELVRSTVF